MLDQPQPGAPRTGARGPVGRLVMRHSCRKWEAVSDVSFNVYQDMSTQGYYALMVQHRHCGSTDLVLERYGALTWAELQSAIEAICEAHRPGFRHAWLQQLQERLWGPSSSPLA